jgi:hypothetical protein
MRKRIKVYSFVPDGRVLSLEEEKPNVDAEKRKELTFKFDYDKKESRFEIAPLSEKRLIEKAKRCTK